MKTVITSSGNTDQALFDVRFGRAAWFFIWNQETGEKEFLENPFKDASNGAGTKVSEKMIELGVEKVVSGDFGPKAKELLEKFNIQLVVVENQGQSIVDMVSKMS